MASSSHGAAAATPPRKGTYPAAAPSLSRDTHHATVATPVDASGDPKSSTSNPITTTTIITRSARIWLRRLRIRIDRDRALPKHRLRAPSFRPSSVHHARLRLTASSSSSNDKSHNSKRQSIYRPTFIPLPSQAHCQHSPTCSIGPARTQSRHPATCPPIHPTHTSHPSVITRASDAAAAPYIHHRQRKRRQTPASIIDLLTHLLPARPRHTRYIFSHSQPFLCTNKQNHIINSRMLLKWTCDLSSRTTAANRGRLVDPELKATLTATTTTTSTDTDATNNNNKSKEGPQHTTTTQLTAAAHAAKAAAEAAAAEMDGHGSQYQWFAWSAKNMEIEPITITAHTTPVSVANADAQAQTQNQQENSNQQQPKVQENKNTNTTATPSNSHSHSSHRVLTHVQPKHSNMQLRVVLKGKEIATFGNVTLDIAALFNHHQQQQQQQPKTEKNFQVKHTMPLELDIQDPSQNNLVVGTLFGTLGAQLLAADSSSDEDEPPTPEELAAARAAQLLNRKATYAVTHSTLVALKAAAEDEIMEQKLAQQEAAEAASSNSSHSHAADAAAKLDRVKGKAAVEDDDDDDDVPSQQRQLQPNSKRSKRGKENKRRRLRATEAEPHVSELLNAEDAYAEEAAVSAVIAEAAKPLPDDSTADPRGAAEQVEAEVKLRVAYAVKKAVAAEHERYNAQLENERVRFSDLLEQAVARERVETERCRKAEDRIMHERERHESRREEERSAYAAARHANQLQIKRLSEALTGVRKEREKMQSELRTAKKSVTAARLATNEAEAREAKAERGMRALQVFVDKCRCTEMREELDSVRADMRAKVDALTVSLDAARAAARATEIDTTKKDENMRKQLLEHMERVTDLTQERESARHELLEERRRVVELRRSVKALQRRADDQQASGLVDSLAQAAVRDPSPKGKTVSASVGVGGDGNNVSEASSEALLQEIETGSAQADVERALAQAKTARALIAAADEAALDSRKELGEKMQELYDVKQAHERERDAWAAEKERLKNDMEEQLKLARRKLDDFTSSNDARASALKAAEVSSKDMFSENRRLQKEVRKLQTDLIAMETARSLSDNDAMSSKASYEESLESKETMLKWAQNDAKEVRASKLAIEKELNDLRSVHEKLVSEKAQLEQSIKEISVMRQVSADGAESVGSSASTVLSTERRAECMVDAEDKGTMNVARKKKKKQKNRKKSKGKSDEKVNSNAAATEFTPETKAQAGQVPAFEDDDDEEPDLPATNLRVVAPKNYYQQSESSEDDEEDNSEKFHRVPVPHSKTRAGNSRVAGRVLEASANSAALQFRYNNLLDRYEETQQSLEQYKTELERTQCEMKTATETFEQHRALLENQIEALKEVVSAASADLASSNEVTSRLSSQLERVEVQLVERKLKLVSVETENQQLKKRVGGRR